MILYVFYRIQIRRSCLQRKLLETLSVIINKKKKERENKTRSKHFCKHLQEFLHLQRYHKTETLCFYFGIF